jgi:hypothetical protein
MREASDGQASLVFREQAQVHAPHAKALAQGAKPAFAPRPCDGLSKDAATTLQSVQMVCRSIRGARGIKAETMAFLSPRGRGSVRGACQLTRPRDKGRA